MLLISRDIIEDGILSMKRTVTLADIAKRAGVSRAVAGVVLTGAGEGKIRVSRKKADLIRDVAQEVNYRPNQMARQLAGKRSRLIGVLVSPIPNPITATRLEVIERQARVSGYRLLIGYEAVNHDLITQYLDDFHGWGAEGIICIHHHYPDDREMIPRLVSEAFPSVVFLDEPALPDLWSVGTDYPAGTRLLVRHLADRGCRRIGLVINELIWFSGPRYFRGYQEGLQEAGLPFDRRLAWVGTEHALTSNSPTLPHDLVENLLQDLCDSGHIDGLIVTSETWAVQIAQVYRETRGNIPGDLALATYGNSPLTRLVHPHLTGLDTRLAYVAKRSVQLLTSLLDGQETGCPRAELITPVLVQAEST